MVDGSSPMSPAAHGAMEVRDKLSVEFPSGKGTTSMPEIPIAVAAAVVVAFCFLVWMLR